MKISNLTEGQTLYSVERVPMGNTSLKTTAVFMVHIKSVEPDGNSFTASWNSNPARTYYKVPSTWKAKKPILVVNRMTARLATKEEIAAGGKMNENSCYFTIFPRE